MDHVAIMKKEWHLLPKILSGEKTMESRWYKNKSAPWGRVKAGDTIYFKDSGEPVTAKAVVAKVLAFAGLTSIRVKEILARYGQADGIRRPEIAKFSETRSASRRIVSRADPDPASGGRGDLTSYFKDKKYCLLIFLKNPRSIKPFRISKRGFGLQAAWLCVDDINRLKRNTALFDF